MHHLIKYRDYSVDHPGHSPVSKKSVNIWNDQNSPFFHRSIRNKMTLKIPCASPLSLSLSFYRSLSLSNTKKREDEDVIWMKSPFFYKGLFMMPVRSVLELSSASCGSVRFVPLLRCSRLSSCRRKASDRHGNEL